MSLYNTFIALVGLRRSVVPEHRTAFRGAALVVVVL